MSRMAASLIISSNMTKDPKCSNEISRAAARLHVLGCLTLSTGAPSQSVPTLINYQGQIADSSGTPLSTADYALTFNIYDASQSGNLIWGPQVFDGQGSLGHGPKIPVVQGYFNVMLGPTDTAGRSLVDNFNSPSRYLEIAVSNRPPMLPRQQILSAPYAFKAANADKLAGYDWAAFFDNGNPQSGSISAGRLISGSISTAQIGDNQVSGAKIANGAVTGSKLLDGEIIASKIADRAVTTSKLDDAVITPRTIQGSSVTSPAIADGAVVTAKIGDGVVLESKLGNNAVSTRTIQDTAVQTAKLADGTVTEVKLASLAVSSPKLQDASVTALKLAPALRPRTKKTSASSFINAVVAGGNGIYVNAFTLTGPGTLTGISLKGQTPNGTASFTLRVTMDGTPYTVSAIPPSNGYNKILYLTAWGGDPPTLSSSFQLSGGAGSASDFSFGFNTSLSIDLRVDSNTDGRVGYYVATSYDN